jgi:hypothetical protein
MSSKGINYVITNHINSNSLIRSICTANDVTSAEVICILHRRYPIYIGNLEQATLGEWLDILPSSFLNNNIGNGKAIDLEMYTRLLRLYKINEPRL